MCLVFRVWAVRLVMSLFSCLPQTRISLQEIPVYCTDRLCSLWRICHGYCLSDTAGRTGWPFIYVILVDQNWLPACPSPPPQKKTWGRLWVIMCTWLLALLAKDTWLMAPVPLPKLFTINPSPNKQLPEPGFPWWAGNQGFGPPL